LVFQRSDLKGLVAAVTSIIRWLPKHGPCLAARACSCALSSYNEIAEAWQ